MLNAPALEVTGVSKRFGPREALRGVDLIAQPGQLHALLGPNGAGKTTLMRVLLGLFRRDAGTVRLLGRDLDSMAGRVPDEVAGLVEAPAFYPYLSGRKNLALLARLDEGRGSESGGDRINDVLEQAGLAAKADVAVGAYSAGMRQRLGLAASMLRMPRLLFLDEPTNALDPAGAYDVRNLARDLANRGAAVVWSSHDMAEVEELCTVLTVIDRGCVIFTGTVNELRSRAPADVHMLRTSNDAAALDLAFHRAGVSVGRADGGLEVSADIEALDAYIIALGCAGIAVRVLERRARTLESMFLELTGDGGGRQRGGSRDAAGTQGGRSRDAVATQTESTVMS
jgi:ABC-2 type transport system ATP-binding protein